MFNIIAAMTKGGRGIGYRNGLPWPLIKTDMNRFTKITTETENEMKRNSVIMGRKTWESLPRKFRPLPNRENIVVSSEYTVTSVATLKTLEEAINYSNKQSGIENTYVIGGEQIYKEAIQNPKCSKIYITEIEKEYTSDKYFPEIPSYMKKILEEEEYDSTVKSNIVFKTYDNIIDWESDEWQYLDLVKRILTEGREEKGRNGKVLKLFGPQHTFDLQKGFPILTTKKVPLRLIIEELLFFLRGYTDTKIMSDKRVKIWDANTTREFLDDRGLLYKEGDMGPMYGYNWRHFGYNYTGCERDYTGDGYDQLYALVRRLIYDPTSRRHLLTTYDPSTTEKSVLAPCHGLITQFNVRGEELDCKMYQRSVDVALGYPFNIASYALLTHILAHVTGYKVGRLIMTLGDCHIYEDHIDTMRKQLERYPLIKPTLNINKSFAQQNQKIRKLGFKEAGAFESVERTLKYIENLRVQDIKLENYNSYGPLKMKMQA